LDITLSKRKQSDYRFQMIKGVELIKENGNKE